MNPTFQFEIVRRPNDRFGWTFVRVGRSGRSRVLARSVRDYGSPQKVENAIDRTQDAPIEDTTLVQDPFPLPNTRFRIVSGVVPLTVDDDEFPEGDETDGVFTAAAISEAERDEAARVEALRQAETLRAEVLQQAEAVRQAEALQVEVLRRAEAVRAEAEAVRAKALRDAQVVRARAERYAEGVRAKAERQAKAKPRGRAKGKPKPASSRSGTA
jgi:hypothetical protein